MIVYANVLHTASGPNVFQKILTTIDTWSIGVRGKMLANGNTCEIESANHSSPDQFPLYRHTTVSHPDGEGVKGRKWFTRIGVTQQQPDSGCTVSIVLETSDISVLAGSARATATRPRVVEEIVKAIGHLAPPSPQATVSILKAGDATMLDQEIEDEGRDYAIILVSQEPYSEQFPFDPNKLLSQVIGLAHVYKMETKRTGLSLRDILGPERSTWGGAINILYPRRPSSHYVPSRIFSLDDLVKMGDERNRISFILQFLTHRFNLPRQQAEISLHALRQTDFQNKLKAAEIDASENQSVVGLYKEEVANLNEQIEKLKSEVQSYVSEWETASSELDERDRDIQSLRAYNAGLIAKLKEIRGDDVDIPPQTVSDAVDQALRRHANCFILSPNSKSEHTGSSFRSPDELSKAFDWLANTYRRAKMGEIRVPLLHQNIKTACPGWDYSARQSEVTTGDYREWYECAWEGQKYSIHEHVSYGQAHNPERTIRIAFHWLESEKKILIGFIGWHQRTTAT